MKEIDAGVNMKLQVYTLDVSPLSDNALLMQYMNCITEDRAKRVKQYKAKADQARSIGAGILLAMAYEQFQKENGESAGADSLLSCRVTAYELTQNGIRMVKGKNAEAGKALRQADLSGVEKQIELSGVEKQTELSGVEKQTEALAAEKLAGMTQQTEIAGKNATEGNEGKDATEGSAGENTTERNVGENVTAGIVSIAELCKLAETLPVEKMSERGKPYFEVGPYYNISHAQDMVALAMAKEDVGIDLERTRACKESVIKRCFTEDEIRRVHKAGCHGEQVFTQIWTQKEAAAKLTGAGLADILDKKEPDGIKMRSIWLDEAYVLTICMAGEK